ncbi:Aste57867_18501 [Aphanomyces stellatus]|uniref:Aste57867_18501 protein n=1 Tax=Aphanomyces stellatus TaxID=120398 RepID=A0A485LE12_9STRA|nr:hypothetical protein As57867_018439 [Aphanomyces stellatus]VFT95237.1 Aste57867_18501 [Aphanomyces stellatus]
MAAALPAALGPVHANDIITTMEQAMHNHYDTRVAGEATLQQCMKLPGFSLLCLQILDESKYPLADPVRLMAALSLKNTVFASWTTRGSRQFIISDEEKTQVRAQLLAHMDESNSAVATQLAVTIARIARSDFPKDWPDLFGVLRDVIQQGSLLQQTRALRVLKSVVKELASRRLAPHRAAFNDMSAAVCPFLATVWKNHVAHLSTGNQDGLANLLSCTKVLHHLVLNGFKVLMPLDVIPFIFTNYYDTFRALTTYIQTLPPDAPGVTLLNKIRVACAGLVVAVQKAHPIEFRAYLGPFLQMFYTTLTDPVESPDALVVHMLTYMTNVVGCLLYQQSPSTLSTTRAVITAAGDVELTDAIVDECKTQIGAFGNDVNLLSSLLELVVVRYMRLTPVDIAQWQEDPEGYAAIQESVTSEDSVRACAEILYLSLLQTHRDMLTPCALNMIQSTSAWMAAPTPVQEDILRADAVLLAAGLSSYDLHESFDFEPWFLHTLVPFLQSPLSQTVSGVPVLPRRIVWLIACWLAQLSNQVRIPLYESLLQLLSAPKSDTCVKLSAVQTLESLVNDWGFDQTTFVPFLPTAISCLYGFFGDPDVATTETRLKILGCLEAIVHVCGSVMGSSIVQVVNPLPSIWEVAGSSDANLLRGKILSLLTRIMEIEWQGASDVELQNMVLSVVSFATNPNQPDSVYLMDEGLALWIRLTEVVEVYTPALHDIFANIVLALSRDTEHIQSGLTLFENYVVIGTSNFWSTYALDVSRLLRSFVGQVKPEISHTICRVIDKMLQSLPADSLGCLQDVLSAFWEITQEDPRQEKELVIISFLTTLAASSLHAPALFFAVIPAENAGVYLDTLLQLFFSVAFTAVGPVRRRIWVCSLCTFLTISKAVLDRLGMILEATVEVVGEVDPLELNDEEGSTSRSLLMAQKAKLLPPTLPYIKQYVIAQLNKCAQMVGMETFNQAMAMVEGSVVTKVQAL